MPNWCSNRMYFSGEPAQIAEIKRLASGAVTPLYRRATNEGIQLFLAGSAGLLQTTEDVRFEPCPGLTAAGRGVVSPENIAFTRSLLPVCRDFPVVRPLRFRGLTLQLPSAVCVRLRLPLRPVHPRLIARLFWRHGTARCRGICEQRRKTSCNMRNLSL